MDKKEDSIQNDLKVNSYQFEKAFYIMNRRLRLLYFLFFSGIVSMVVPYLKGHHFNKPWDVYSFILNESTLSKAGGFLIILVSITIIMVVTFFSYIHPVIIFIARTAGYIFVFLTAILAAIKAILYIMQHYIHFSGQTFSFISSGVSFTIEVFVFVLSGFLVALGLRNFFEDYHPSSGIVAPFFGSVVFIYILYGWMGL